MKRVYEVDPLVCPRCQGEMRIVAFIIDHQVIDRILRHLAVNAGHRDRGPPGWADLLHHVVGMSCRLSRRTADV